MSTLKRLTHDDYVVGWICPLEIEQIAALRMLDELHQRLPQNTVDHNVYNLGSINGHNIVVAGLPSTGNNPAATVVTQMRNTFRSLRFCLLVGIGGGVPIESDSGPIRLGDVVVSKPVAEHSGAVQYDRGKAEAGSFTRTGFLQPPPAVLLNAAQDLAANRAIADQDPLAAHLDRINTKKRELRKYRFPGRDNDHLYDSEYTHPHSASSCVECKCDPSRRVHRVYGDEEEEDDDAYVLIHRGTIASGELVMKNGMQRDGLAKKLGVYCFEMEAAGALCDFGCLVIRGISDYADSHKNNQWHGFAAAVAAAYARQLFFHMPVDEVKRCSVAIEDIENIKDGIEGLHEQSNKQEVRYQNDQHGRCHQAFKTSTYEQFKDINPDRIEGTCLWVLTHPIYLQWRQDTSDSLLWISADPGCGKSVLSKWMIDRELHEGHSSNDTICYFFFKDNEEQNDLAIALCAILHQLFYHQPHLLQHAMPAYGRNGENIQREVGELWQILLEAGSDKTASTITCIFDALDECRDNDRSRLIAMLSNFHADTASQSTRQSSLKFLVTSRPYDDIQRGFDRIPESLPAIHLRGELENDQLRGEIELVIKLQVEQLSRELDLSPNTTTRLEQRLLEMEHRTYLWLHLAIGDIRVTYRDSLWPDEESLPTIPCSVEDAYEKILARATKKDTSIVMTILKIIVGARRPLSIEEMTVALGISEDGRTMRPVQIKATRLEERLRNWCGLFVFTNHSRIYLIHQTAREFLLSRDESMARHNPATCWKHSITQMDADSTLMFICVYILCKGTSAKSISQGSSGQSSSSQDDVNDITQYACEWWPDHFRDASCTSAKKALSDVLGICNTTSGVFRLWFPRYYNRVRPYYMQENITEDLCLAAFNGHDLVVHQLLYKEHLDADTKDYEGRTPLYWASTMGYTTVVQILLDKGVDINAQGGHYVNALQAASAEGHDKIVQMLLDKGADVNAQGEEFYGNALQAASARGHDKIVQMLLDKGADVNAQGEEFYGNALQVASAEGHDKVVQMLLDKGADINAQGGEFYGNALQVASARGHDKITQMLLDKGADVNAQGGQFGNALQAASARGHDKIVQMLLDKGADINAQGGHYGNALQAASARGHDKVVQMLLDKGADINAQGGEFYGNALQVASARGHDKITQMLLDKGVDINAQGGHYVNALQAASAEGHDKIVQMLLDKGADVNAQGGQFGNALQAASAKGHDRIVQMLHDRGAVSTTEE